MPLSRNQLLQGALLIGAIALLPAYCLASERTIGRPMLAPAASSSIEGTVVGIGEADENEWRIETSSGVVVVDAGERERQAIDLEMGETVTIDGEFDRGEFDAFTITRADGTVIEVLAAEDWDY